MTVKSCIFEYYGMRLSAMWDVFTDAWNMQRHQKCTGWSFFFLLHYFTVCILEWRPTLWINWFISGQKLGVRAQSPPLMCLLDVNIVNHLGYQRAALRNICQKHVKRLFLFLEWSQKSHKYCFVVFFKFLYTLILHTLTNLYCTSQYNIEHFLLAHLC